MTSLAGKIYEKAKHFVVKNRRVVLAALYLLQAVLANYFAFVLRFESMIPAAHLSQFRSYLPILLLVRLVFFLQSGLYKDMWRYSSVGDLMKIIKSTTLGSLFFLLIIRYVTGDMYYPRSIYFLDWLLLITISGGVRFSIRVVREYLQSEPSGRRVLLVGAGDAGEMIVRDMKSNPKYNYEPIGFIDDNPFKKGSSIHGIPIFGPRTMIGEVIERYKPDEIIISIPSLGQKDTREIYELCKNFHGPVKILPGVAEIIEGKVSVAQIKPLSIEDLLQREPVRRDIATVRDYIKGKSVLVTGAGGSIGSELCRQIIEYGPSLLIMLDRYENGLFSINHELEAKGKGHAVSAIVGDILDVRRLEDIFRKHSPQIIFHAAAHKHVPLMEQNPLEAVKNNIFGTQNMVDVAASYGVEEFVMISTDKAVNPTNIMGATKRVAEFIAIHMNTLSSTKFTTVRFGNVLGSNGSVLDVFRKQLRQGGPLTVTHPDIKRFFMLIPEAVQLVLIAAASGKGGEIFVLDMGEQIKIVELAENLIRLSGLVPHEDIKIEFIGLRPGEKMYEELFDESERRVPTSDDKLKVAVPDNIPSMDTLLSHIVVLRQIVSKNSTDDLVPEIRKIVPNFLRDYGTS